MESAGQKRRRLWASSIVPARVLAELLKRLRREPNLDEALNISEWKLNKAISSLWAEVGLAESLQLCKGGDFTWHCASLAKLLQHATQSSPFSDLQC